MSQHFPVTRFWEVLLVNRDQCHYGNNTIITQTSTLFIEKQRGAWNGPRESLWGSSIWLAKWLLTKKHSGLQTLLFKGQDYWNGVPVMTYVVSSHCIYAI